jgi:hypothetical protein
MFRSSAGVSFKQTLGNTTLTVGVGGLVGCASTVPGISSNNIDWGHYKVSLSEILAQNIGSPPHPFTAPAANPCTTKRCEK